MVPASSKAGKIDGHGEQQLFTAGVPLAEARRAMLLLHGRGASAQSILELGNELDLSSFTLLAPQAVGQSWYPNSFLAPLESNEPWLSSSLLRVEQLISEINSAGLASDRIALLGFSQGACLALEFAARHPRRYGVIAGLTGGLIGPPGTPRNYRGHLAGTPVFLGCGDPDSHVPFARVEETRDVLTRMGAAVELRRYPGLPHTINADELDAVQKMVRDMPE